MGCPVPAVPCLPAIPCLSWYPYNYYGYAQSSNDEKILRQVVDDNDFVLLDNKVGHRQIFSDSLSRLKAPSRDNSDEIENCET